MFSPILKEFFEAMAYFTILDDLHYYAVKLFEAELDVRLIYKAVNTGLTLKSSLRLANTEFDLYNSMYKCVFPYGNLTKLFHGFEDLFEVLCCINPQEYDF